MRFRIKLIIVLLITYGSLYPFDFKIPEPHTAAWVKLFANWSWATSKADALGNLALFLPLGFAGVFALPCSARLGQHFTSTFLMSLGVAIVLQAAQIYAPDRTASLADVFWNMMGATAGGVAGLLVGARTPFPWHRWQTEALPLSVLALWLAAELIPFVPSLDVQTLKATVTAILHPTFVPEQVAVHAAGAAVAGWALAMMVGEARSLVWLVLLTCVAAVSKAAIVTRALDVSTLCGFALGYGLWRALTRLYEPTRSRALVLMVLGAYALNALVPFQIRIEPEPLNWVPFAALLKGSMLLNSQALAQNLCLYAGIIAVFRVNRASPVAASFALALVVALFELLQTHLVGRTPDITDPLLVLVLGQIIAVVPLPTNEQESSRQAPERDARSPGVPERQAPAIRPFSFIRWGTAFMIVAGAMALLFSIILRLPKIPYNLSELFLGDAAFPFMVIFAVALLWIGAGARLVGYCVAVSSRPYLLLPLFAFGAGIVSLLLLCSSVTQESVSDIAGSTNLHWFVTHKDIWGVWARQIFLLIPADVVAFAERPVRYAALYGPLVTFLALIFIGIDRHAKHCWNAKTQMSLALSAGLWLWLCKAIAFDWSSTDNLNELIARDGPWGWGGGGYLYALLALICANAALLTRAAFTIGGLVASVFITFALLPAGWWLLNQGLEQGVHKYGMVFSGAQFLLGPDRKNILGADVLFLRWSLVQIGGVLVTAAGARLAQPVILWLALRSPKSKSSSGAGDPGQRGSDRVMHGSV